MMLTREEAISLVLSCSQGHEVSGKTKLNKLLARLNLFMVPVDIQFTLNKYGSFSTEVTTAQGTQFYDATPYQYNGSTYNKLKITTSGLKLVEEITEKKLKKLLTPNELIQLKNTILELSRLNASGIAEEEHHELLVDKDDRTQLIHRINDVNVRLFDLYANQKKIKEENIAVINFKALVEFSFYLSKYLRERRFKHIETQGYDFEAYMLDYYLLYLLHEEVIPLMENSINNPSLEAHKIDRIYQYFTTVTNNQEYPFSLNSADLAKLVP